MFTCSISQTPYLLETALNQALSSGVIQAQLELPRTLWRMKAGLGTPQTAGNVAMVKYPETS